MALAERRTNQGKHAVQVLWAEPVLLVVRNPIPELLLTERLQQPQSVRLSKRRRYFVGVVESGLLSEFFARVLTSWALFKRTAAL